MPNSFLRKKASAVDTIDNDIKHILDDMLETMYAANGIGLAAIQIGVPKRIIVMDLSRNSEKKNPKYFVNPVILNKNQDKNTYEEGCLSVPNQFAEIDRPSKCDVEYLDYFGEKRLLKAQFSTDPILGHLEEQRLREL